MFGKPGSGKTIMADGLKKQAQLMDRTPIIFDDWFDSSNMFDDRFQQAIVGKTDVILVTTNKVDNDIVK